MSQGFSSVERAQGTQTPSPCPAPPSPLGMEKISYFKNTRNRFGTYNGGRSGEEQGISVAWSHVNGRSERFSSTYVGP